MKVHCVVCGRGTSGIKGRGAASKKSVSRKFGCELCSGCLRCSIMEANRVREKRKSIEDVGMGMRKYVQNLVAG